MAVVLIESHGMVGMSPDSSGVETSFPSALMGVTPRRNEPRFIGG